MKHIIVFTFLIFWTTILAQKDMKVLVLVSNDFSLVSRPYLYCFNGNNIALGIQSHNFSFATFYQFGGEISDGGKHYDYNYHQIGISYKYSFLKETLKIRPFFQIKISSQVSTNYENGLMSQFIGKIEQSSYSLQELSQQSDHYFDNYEEYDSWVGNVYYKSTAFIGNITVGCDFQIYHGLNLNVGIGFGLRNIKVREPISNANNFNYLFSVDAQLGLSYTLPLKRKTKVTDE